MKKLHMGFIEPLLKGSLKEAPTKGVHMEVTEKKGCGGSHHVFSSSS